MATDCYKILKKYWGYESFRPLQKEIIDAVVAQRDTLALLPTGGGKSLCYQVPALMMEGIGLVVSPLIALMKDQVQQLNDRHIKAACLVSGMSQDDVATVLNNCLYGNIKFLYVSPERLRQRMFIEHLKQMKLCMIAVDEAHCVSQWGYDFRPPYLQIADIRLYHPKVPMIALTATATEVVADDIVKQLQMNQVARFKSSFIRSNLSYQVLYNEDLFERLVRLVREYRGSCIVYTRNRRSTRRIAEQLEAHGIKATYYHAGLTPRERDSRQALWMQGTAQVMVATNAFGMGIDKSDVRLVVHVDIPDSIESYFQEAGRAGRDGKPAACVLFANQASVLQLNENFQSEFPTLKYVRNCYRALCNYFSIPMGSGLDATYDFDLAEVCNYYNFEIKSFYQACRILEREGLIAIPDRDELASTLQIVTPRDELYRFQVEHFKLGNLVTEVLRIYPGITTSPMPIDEKLIAKRVLVSVEEVVQMLTSLHAFRIADYRRRSNKPRITFTSIRIDEKSIYLNEQDYKNLKSRASGRLSAMLNYIKDRNHCRSMQLVTYFGEHVEELSVCGICDVCRSRVFNGNDLKKKILDNLSRGRMSIRNLCDIVGEPDYARVEEVVKEMLDCGRVVLDRDLMLSLQ